jgi:hypothetical protein
MTKHKNKVFIDKKEVGAWKACVTIQRWNKEYTDIVNVKHYCPIFRANDVEEAKKIIFEFVLKKAKKFKNIKSLDVLIEATPYIYDDKEKKLVGDGTKMIRNKQKFTNMSVFIKTKPDKIFVVGYGPEVVAKLDEK